MSFVIVAVGAMAAGTIYSANVSKDNADKQAKAQLEAAKQQQDFEAAKAKQQEEAATASQNVQFEFEKAREAAQNQQNADLATGAQNQKVSDAAPTVQLAAQGDDGSAAAARKRRATFRPDYASGVTI